MYDEGGGKKGGNNVASLLYNNLEVEGVIKEWEDSGKKPGKRLSLCFNNCSIYTLYYFYMQYSLNAQIKCIASYLYNSKVYTL